MRRSAFLLLVIVSFPLAADVFKPPVLLGVGNGSGRRSDAPIPFPSANEAWVRVVTPHFTIVSAAGEKRTREIAENLETLAAGLAQLHARFQPATSSTRVLLFNRRRESQPYFDFLLDRRDANVAGVFVAQRNGGTMIVDASRDWRTERTPYHELIHNLLASGDARPPLWIEEGLAEYFSSAEIRGGVIRAGAPIREHADVLRRRSAIPLEQFFAVKRESDTYNLQSGQSLFYAQSWAAVSTLLRWNRPAFYDFLHDVESGAGVEAALQSRYHRTLRDLRDAIDAAASSLDRPSYGLVMKVPEGRAAIAFEKIDRSEVLYQLGRFLESADDDSSESQRHFNAAIDANPKHGRALAALGRYDDAIAATPADPEVHLLYAESLLGHEIGRLAEANTLPDDAPARFRRARTLVERAIALGANDGRAFGDLGTTYLVESDLAPGIAALQQAHALAPSRNDFALHLFAMYRRTGDVAHADALFAQLDRARDEQVAYAARALVVRIELDRANELTKAQKLDEAAAVIRGLAAITKDPLAKNDLERQAGDIARVAETNRHIRMYNAAIGQINTGHYRDARKTLQELLAQATDADVIRDVKKLQKELAARR
jgi:tetratricopeptide (TPR) repeat protein